MHIVIIGNGISGITAARYIRKLSNHNITVISAETKYFYSRTALMYIYMGHMTYQNTKPYEDWFWEKNRIALLQEYVTDVDTKHRKIRLQNGTNIEYDKLILATGSASNKFGWKGQDLPQVQGLYNMQDLVKMEKNTNNIQHAVVVGGGLIGIEMVEMLQSRRIPTTLLVREKSFWDIVLPPEESQIINRQIRKHHVDLQLETELNEILADENGDVRAVTTKDGKEIPCQFVGLTVGVHPNIGFLKDSGIETQKGILVDEYFQTNVEDVYAIGDCAQLRNPPAGRRPIEAVWYIGRIQGKTVAHTICGQKVPYQPRIWFNSAKFMDIEYQTYGTVLNSLQEDEAQLYWEHSDGEKCIKIVYEKASEKVVGFNLMGIRFRHDVCEEWLHEGRDLQYVLQHLRAANFDPEIYDQHENGIIEVYNQQFPNRRIEVKSKKSLWNMIFKRKVLVQN
ncbi:MAG: FAD-dependent oxidoreductase [Chitinophagales bacterium]